MGEQFLLMPAHGNGPFCRDTEWALAINDELESRGLERRRIIVPLMYPQNDRQKRITREEVHDNCSERSREVFEEEVWYDHELGRLVMGLTFKGSDYEEYLRKLVEGYQKIENDIHTHIHDDKREIRSFNGERTDSVRLGESVQLNLNNRVQTYLGMQYYAAGGAGPFDEVLSRARRDPQVKIDKGVIRKAYKFANRLMWYQSLIFANEPGVFSYNWRDNAENTIMTPPFIHPKPKVEIERDGKGVFVLMTGIDGVRESGMYGGMSELGLKVYCPHFTYDNLPEEVRKNAVKLRPAQLNNDMIVAIYGRAGWSTVWDAHLCEKGFLTPPHAEKDDPEIYFNLRGINWLGLGTIIGSDPRAALEEATRQSTEHGQFNASLVENYGTLDGIRYAAKVVVNDMLGVTIAVDEKRLVEPAYPT